MNGSRAGWLSLLVLMSVLTMGQVPKEALTESAQPETQPEAEASKGLPAPLWNDPGRLVSAATEGSWSPAAADGSGWEKLGDKARTAGFTRLDPLIALVPCPVDSNLAADFDQALAAIHEAYADSGYLLDGWFLPWTGDAEKDKLHNSTPGLLIFRRFDRREMAVVLLVGEVPALGIHRTAFQNAVRAVQLWGGAEGRKPVTIRIVGPTLSDSALSLQLAIEEWKGRGLSFEVVTGSARAKQLGDRPWTELGSQVSFERTVVDEHELQDRARWFFEQKMGWDLDQVALLTQADGAYGRPFLTKENTKSFVIVHFPSGIAGVRNAWDQDRQPKPSNGGAKKTIEVPDTTLDLRLGDPRRPEVIPALSPTTWASRDLAIANLLATIGNRKIRYIGILATDVRDAIFLVERVRRFAPGSVVFLINNNLLYTHPRLAETMSGTLVISEYPLFTQDSFAIPPRHSLSQFTSGLHQGIYEAVRRLVATPVVPSSRGRRTSGWPRWPTARCGRSQCSMEPGAPRPARSFHGRRALTGAVSLCSCHRVRRTSCCWAP